MAESAPTIIAPALSSSDRPDFHSAGAVRKNRAPRRFEIYNVNLGEILGTYEARTEGDALDAMARAYGFADYDAVIAGYSVSREEAIGELQITEAAR